MSSAEGLLIAVLRQCTRPSEPEDCAACEAMQMYADTVRLLAPASAGSDLCPWHAGQEQGWRDASKAVQEALS